MTGRYGMLVRAMLAAGLCVAAATAGKVVVVRWFLPGVVAGDPALEGPPFPFRQTATDAEPLLVLEGVVEALRPDRAALADPLGLAGRAALLGEEGLGVGLRAQRLLHPGVLGDAGEEHEVHRWFSLAGRAQPWPPAGWRSSTSEPCRSR